MWCVMFKVPILLKQSWYFPRNAGLSVWMKKIARLVEVYHRYQHLEGLRICVSYYKHYWRDCIFVSYWGYTFLRWTGMLVLLFVVRVTEVDFSFERQWRLLYMVLESTFITAPKMILKSTIEPLLSKFAVQSLTFLSLLSGLLENVCGTFERRVT